MEKTRGFQNAAILDQKLKPLCLVNARDGLRAKRCRNSR
jgi:hypothetical protein